MTLCELCDAELDDAAEPCRRCGVPQPGSPEADRLGRADRRRRRINTAVILVLVAIVLVVFAQVEDPSQRAWHQICVATKRADC